MTLPPEKRVIKLSVTAVGSLLSVSIRNYYEGQPLRFVGGLPQTTKGSQTYHGYGVKSIKKITESYGGSFSVAGTARRIAANAEWSSDRSILRCGGTCRNRDSFFNAGAHCRSLFFSPRIIARGESLPRRHGPCFHCLALRSGLYASCPQPFAADACSCRSDDGAHLLDKSPRNCSHCHRGRGRRTRFRLTLFL